MLHDTPEMAQLRARTRARDDEPARRRLRILELEAELEQLKAELAETRRLAAASGVSLPALDVEVRAWRRLRDEERLEAARPPTDEESAATRAVVLARRRIERESRRALGPHELAAARAELREAEEQLAAAKERGRAAARET